jgi:hypothetical protein
MDESLRQVLWALGFAGFGIFRSGSTSPHRFSLARLGAAQAALKESGATAYTAAGG